MFKASRSQQGFTLAELLVVIIVIGMISVIAGLELRSLNTSSRMNGAVSQVARSLGDAYSMAQAEKVKVTVKFYSNSDSDVDKRNKYEVLRGDASEPVKPPIGISYDYDEVEGLYYYKMPDSSSQPTIAFPVTVVFKPLGSTIRVWNEATSAPTNHSITFSYTGLANKIVTINSEGEVSP